MVQSLFQYGRLPIGSGPRKEFPTCQQGIDWVVEDYQCRLWMETFLQSMTQQESYFDTNWQKKFEWRNLTSLLVYIPV